MIRQFVASLLAIPLAIALISPFSHGQLSQVDMTDKEISVFLSGNTIGAHDWGIAQSFEYHSPDGQAIWREGDELQVGVYRVKGGQVCYNYDASAPNDWFCWDFKRDIRTGDVYQWSQYGDHYRMYIYAEGDVVSTEFDPQPQDVPTPPTPPTLPTSPTMADDEQTPEMDAPMGDALSQSNDITREEILAFIADQTLLVELDGPEFAIYHDANGEFTFIQTGIQESGSYEISGNRICYKRDGVSDSECIDVSRSDQADVFFATPVEYSDQSMAMRHYGPGNLLSEFS